MDTPITSERLPSIPQTQTFGRQVRLSLTKVIHHPVEYHPYSNRGGLDESSRAMT